MIKINLVPRKRPRHSDEGQQSLVIGMLVLVALGVAVFFLVHSPLGDELSELEDATARISRQNKEKEKELKGFKELKEAVEAAQARSQTITRLNDARATPAHLLYELSSILTPRRAPTMTKTMSRVIRDNPNREISADWDPKHVWITKFSEQQGQFRLEGGAQSDSDMTQLALRLQASVYFHDVVPEGGSETVDKESGITFYKFTIVGKVAY